MPDKLIVSAGDVIDVQLTSETVVIEGADRRHVEPGHITNRMRLFLRQTDGKEQKYDFEDTELGVRETQRVVVVRGQGKGKQDRGPYNIVLFNISSGERGEFEGGLRIYLGHKPFFGPLWKAAVLAFAVAVVFWLISNFEMRDGNGGTGSSIRVNSTNATCTCCGATPAARNFWSIMSHALNAGSRIRFENAPLRAPWTMTMLPSTSASRSMRQVSSRHS